MRKLASIRRIDEIRPIEGADAIECAVVGGWTVVVKKYLVNDKDVFLSPSEAVKYGLFDGCLKTLPK